MNQSDLLFKNIVEKMVVGIAYFKVITNKKGMPIDLLILNINSSFEEKTGLVAKKVIGKSINQIFPLASKDKDKWIELCGKVALKKKKFTIENYFQRFKRWLRIDLFCPSRGYFVASIIDITKRKLAEEAALESSDKYRSLVNNVNIGIFRTSLVDKGKFLELNPAMIKIYGYKTAKEFSKLPVSAFYGNPEDRIKIIDVLRKDGYINAHEVLAKKKDGSKFWVSTTARIHRDKSGKPDWIDGVVEDITERRNAEMALKELFYRNQALLSAVPDIIMEVDKNKRYTWTNKAGYDFFGKDVIGKPASYYFVGRQQIYKEVESLFKGDESIIYVESWQRRKDGQNRLLAWWCKTLKDKQGKVIGALSTARDITEGKKVEQALFESDARFRQFSENIDQVFWLTDWKNNKLLYVNPAYEKLYDRSCQTSYKNRLDWYNAVHPDDRPRVKEAFDYSARYGKYAEIEYRVVHHDGKIRWILDRSYPIRDNQGKIVQFASIAEDITNSKLAQEALRQSEEKYRSLVKNINIGIYRTTADAQGKFIEINPAAVKILGYSSVDEFRNRKIIDFYVNLKERLDSLKKLKKFGYVKNNELQVKRKDGRVIIVSETAIAHRNHKGKIDWFDGVLEDITRRKNITYALQDSERKYRTLFKVAPYAITAHDGQKFIFANPTTLKLLGAKSEKEFIGKQIWDIVHPDSLKLVQERIARMMKTGKPEPPAVEKFIGLDGTVIEAELYAKPFVYHNKPAIMITALDVTERRKIEAEQKRISEQTIKFQNVLLKLGKTNIINIDQAIRKIINVDANTLNVERVSFWLFQKNNTEFTCYNLFLKSKNTYENGQILKTSTFPNYVHALEKGRLIASNDAQHDPRTKEFTKRYLRPYGITSLLDVPVRLHGKIIGVVCHEHLGPMRNWTTEEQNFAASIADFVSLSIETAEHKTTEISLKDSEKKYRGLVHNVNTGIYRTTPQGKIIEANPMFAHISGYNSTQSLLKLPIIKLYQNPNDRKLFLQKMIRDGQVKNYEIIQRKKDGSLINVSITARAHHNDKGQIDWYDGVVEDITERKKVQDALKESEERYRTVFETANDGILVISPSGVVLSANQQAFKISGLSEKAIGLNIAKSGVLPPHSLEIIQKNMKARLSGKDITPYEIEIYPKNKNSKIIVEISASLLRDTSGKVIADLAIIRDVTERKQYEIELKKAKEAAEAANKAKTAFLHNMSHELRTPLTSIIGFTDVLMDNETDLDNKEMLSIVKNSGNHLLKIINNLLDLSKIEAGRIKVENSLCDSKDLVKELQQRYKLIAYEKGIKYRVIIKKNLPKFLITDCTKINQIVSNLLDNAFKFTEQGTVDLCLGLNKPIRNKKSILEIQVKDTGIGIPKDRIEHIFDKFEQGEYYISKKYGGAGLGLPIIKQLTELMQGTISVKSKLAQGTKFTVLLPIEIPDKKQEVNNVI